VFPVGATGVRETEFQEQMFRNELRVKFTSDNAVLACQSIDEIVGKFRNPLLSGGGGLPRDQVGPSQSHFLLFWADIRPRMKQGVLVDAFAAVRLRHRFNACFRLTIAPGDGFG
jgi:hypothetical protein